MPNGIDPLKNIRRDTRRSDRLPANAVCLFCGTTEPSKLTTMTAERLLDLPAGPPNRFRAHVRSVLIEGHHLFPRGVERDTIIPLCKNCHAKIHELLRDVGMDFAQPEDWTLLHVVHAILRVLAALHQQLSQVLSALADRVWALIEGLDASFEGWDSLPEAKA